MKKTSKSLFAPALAVFAFLSAASPAFAYYYADYAHVVKINVDSQRCDATVCRVIVYFDKDLNIPSTSSCNPTVKDRAVLYLYKSPTASNDAVALDKIYSSAMSAYLSGQQVYARVTGCDATLNLTTLYYLENK